MNTQPPSQHESLSPEERDLARVVRALPGGEPPAALDALILKAASDAVASSHSPKNPRWTKAWLGTSALWLGTAAASILTVGIGWQVFQSMRAPIYELPDDQNVMSRQEIDNSHKEDSLTVDMIPAREPQPTSPPPPALAETESANDAAASAAPAEKPQPAKSEMRARENVARQEMADAMLEKKASSDKETMRRDQAAAEADWVPQTAGAVASAPAAAPPPMPVVAAAPAASARYAESRELDAISVSGSKTKRVAPPEESAVNVISREDIINAGIAEEAKLEPKQWLDAIRNRVKHDDIEGAKASLKLYKQTYPKLRIPEELKPLLK